MKLKKTHLVILAIALALGFCLIGFPATTIITDLGGPAWPAIGSNEIITTLYVFGCPISEISHDGIADSTLEMQAYLINFAIAFALSLSIYKFGGKSRW